MQPGTQRYRGVQPGTQRYRGVPLRTIRRDGALASVHGGARGGRWLRRPLAGRPVAEAPAVETALGALSGAREGPVYCFRGVPYARPPVGPLRFRAPRPVRPWAGRRDAGGGFAASAPQPPQSTGSSLPGDPSGTSEDCLYLNVWTPGFDGAKRPVMVWVHGGAFVTGSGASQAYDGAHLSADHVV
ncbi:MAG: carboxylesterase family protein, partial [Acidimicrobiales bacterium]